MINIYKSNNCYKSLEYANDLNNLAILYDEMGDYEKSEKFYEESAELKKGLLGECNLSYADTLNNLGIIYSNLNKPNKAQEIHKLVLDIRSDLLGEEHTDCLLYTSYNKMEGFK